MALDRIHHRAAIDPFVIESVGRGQVLRDETLDVAAGVAECVYEFLSHLSISFVVVDD
jgi:hypothetical protein